MYGVNCYNDCASSLQLSLERSKDTDLLYLSMDASFSYNVWTFNSQHEQPSGIKHYEIISTNERVKELLPKIEKLVYETTEHIMCKQRVLFDVMYSYEPIIDNNRDMNAILRGHIMRKPLEENNMYNEEFTEINNIKARNFMEHLHPTYLHEYNPVTFVPIRGCFITTDLNEKDIEGMILKNTMYHSLTEPNTTNFLYTVSDPSTPCHKLKDVFDEVKRLMGDDCKVYVDEYCMRKLIF